MEGSAFFQTAQRFVASELAHSVKIVSDNSEAPWQSLNRERVQGWINDLLPLIERMRTELITGSSLAYTAGKPAALCRCAQPVPIQPNAEK